MTRNRGPTPLRWRDGVPAAVCVVAVHAALIGAATLSFTPLSAPDITPPSITGVLVAEASQELVEPASAPASQPVPEVKPQPRPRPKPRPEPPVQAPPTERSITVPEGPVEEARERETSEEEIPPEIMPRPASGAAPDSPAQSEAEAAPPVTPPMLDAVHLQNPAPVYPPASRRRREEGQVLLEVFILADGSVGELKVKRTSGYPALDEAALEAVQRWRFTPARRGSEPIPYWYELPVVFSLRR